MMLSCKSTAILIGMLIILMTVPALAVEGYQITGKVMSGETGAPVAGATVFITENDKLSTSSDMNGNFTLRLKKAGVYHISVVSFGFNKSEMMETTVAADNPWQNIAIYLESAHTLSEVVVQADRNPDKVAKTVITGKELAKTPGTGGDPLRAIQALPGITTANDTQANPAIRGSGPENNLYYVDFLPVGYLFHMGGMISVINSDLVDDFNIYSAAFGPEYGDVTGAVVDVKLREPRKDKIGGKLSMSMLESDVLVEGPVKDNQSFYLAARRSYIDLFMPKTGKLNDSADYQQFPEYYDYQGKYLWKISEATDVSLQLNGASDDMLLRIKDDSKLAAHDPILAGDVDFSQQFHGQGVVVKNAVSPRLTNKFGVSHLGNTIHQQLTNLGHADIDIGSVAMRDHLTVMAGENHELLFAGGYQYVSVDLNLDITSEFPSEFDPDVDFTSAERKQYKKPIYVNGYFLSSKDRWKIFDKFTFIPGVRMSYGDYIGGTEVEPRFGAEYKLTDSTTLLAGWGKFNQAPEGYQMIEEFGNRNLGYTHAEHTVAGVEKKLSSGWSWKLEAYYKRFYDVVVPEKEFVYLNRGSGKAVGAELLVKKDMVDTVSGWMSIARSHSERTNDLTGETFDYKYDQPWILNLVAMYKLTDKWTIGAKWRYQSGSPFTPVTGTYLKDGRIRPTYGAIGSERMPDYHRLDLRADREFNYGTWKMGVFFELINAYAQKNIAGYQYNADYSDREAIYQLPLLPSVGVKAEF